MSVKLTPYEIEINNQARKIALVSVVIFHLVLFLVLYFNGFHIPSPLPAERGLEIIVDEYIPPVGSPQGKPQKVIENPPIVNVPGNSAPESAKPAESNQSTKPAPQPNVEPSDISEEGDVDVVVEKPKKEIKKKALFQNTTEGTEEGNRPSTVNDKALFSGVGNAEQATRTSNTPIGPDHRQPLANLSGRSVVGILPQPAYNSQSQGKVVVQITVNQDGVVTKANAIGKGSTVQDAQLWRAAEEAARKAIFNVKKDAPIFQVGTITYNFLLN